MEIFKSTSIFVLIILFAIGIWGFIVEPRFLLDEQKHDVEVPNLGADGEGKGSPADRFTSGHLPLIPESKNWLDIALPREVVAAGRAADSIGRGSNQLYVSKGIGFSTLTLRFSVGRN